MGKRKNGNQQTKTAAEILAWLTIAVEVVKLIAGIFSN